MKRILRSLTVIGALTLIISIDWAISLDGQELPVITLDPRTTFQTVIGWEAVNQAGETDCSGFSQYSASLFDQAVNDLGINRLRVEIKTPCDMQATCTSTNFDLNQLDRVIDKVLNPIRQRLAAKGEKLWVNLNFVGRSGFPNQVNMSAYAQQVLLTYQHLHNTYGFIPDSWEIVLEPNVVSPQWTEPQIVDAIERSSALLRTNRDTFTTNPNWTPYFIAPSSACGPNTAINAFTAMLTANNNQLPADMREFAYHRYCGTNNQELQTIAGYRTTYGINTAMLEHIGSGYEDLHDDLKLSQVSAWQQYALAFCTVDDGAQYYWINIDDPSNPVIHMGDRTKFLRQYFKFIRSGAVRIAATTSDSHFDPVAFINPNGNYVVVIKADMGGGFSLHGLPAGTYGIKYTTPSEYDVDAADIMIGSGETLSTIIPQRGVITVYAKTTFTVVPPNAVTIEGPTVGAINRPLSFTARVSPNTVSQPLTYTWQASEQALITHTGGLSDTVTFTWKQSSDATAITRRNNGRQTVAVTVANAAGVVTDTHMINLHTPTPPTDITVQGAVTGTINSASLFTATVRPIRVTQPITFTWQASEQAPVTHAHVDRISDNATFTWATANTQTITVTVANAVGMASVHHTIAIGLSYNLYVPTIILGQVESDTK